MTLEIPPPPPPQPLRWRRALAELRALLADPDDTERAISLMYALEAWRVLGWRWLAYDFSAWRRGRRAAWLPALPFEELLPLPLATVRILARVAEAREVHPRGVLRGSLEQPT